MQRALNYSGTRFYPLKIKITQFPSGFRLNFLSISNFSSFRHLFGDATSGFLARVRNERRSSILMTCHYPNLGSASDWSCRVGNLIQPIWSTTQIWVVTRHQDRISALVSQTSFGGETSGGVAKCRMFSQVTFFPVCLVCFSAYSTYSTFMYLFIILKRVLFSVTMIPLIVLEPSRSLFGHR